MWLFSVISLLLLPSKTGKKSREKHSWKWVEEIHGSGSRKLKPLFGI